MQVRVWPRAPVFLLVLVLSAASCAEGIDIRRERESERPREAHLYNGKTCDMTAPQIVESIKQKNWTFTEQPFQIDPDAAPAFIALCDDPDPEIRELNLFALNAIPGKKTRNCVLQALHDEDINVRSTASRFLSSNYSKADLKVLFQELSSNSDEMVRENVALTIGKIGESFAKSRVEKQAAIETDADAAHAIHLALVRLHDEDNRERYLERLRDPDPEQRVAAIQDFEYIEDRAFLKDIAPLLHDEQPGLDVGPSNQRILIRVCDVTVNVLDKVLDHPFGFEVDEFRKYGPEELLAADEVVRNMQ